MSIKIPSLGNKIKFLKSIFGLNSGPKINLYAITVAFYYQNINNHPERVNNINLFLDHYNWKEREFPSHKNYWKKFAKKQQLYVPRNSGEISHAYKSKRNLNRENQVIILMITDGKKWHYLAVKKLSALLRGITSKHDGDFYCLNCLHSYRTKDKLKEHENVCKDHDYCYIEMPNENNIILKYNPGEKSMKTPVIIYSDLESLLEKISTCHNNPKKSLTTKINKHTYRCYKK